MNETAESTTNGAVREAFVERITRSCLGFLDVATLYIGLQLGLYRAFAEAGPATTSQLAQRSGTVERYVREWAEQQAVTGLLMVENPGAETMDRRYSLPAAHAEVLLDADSLSFMGPYPMQMLGTIEPLQAVLRSFRQGGGVPYEAYGANCRDGIAAGNRVAFVNLLGTAWFPAIASLDARLRADPPARVADVGCGFGWSSISIARAYPRARVDAFDLDDASIEVARANAISAGVADRVDFQVRDAAEPGLRQRYDLVTAFETIHDMARPVEALAAMRGLVSPAGMVLVADERVRDEFTVDPGDIERLYYGFSVLHCLPAGMASQPSAATGTVMRSTTLRRYALEAGFSDIEILPVEHDFWRFYRLIG